MISIIICSRQHQQVTRLVKNIEETIGVAHEILITDNSINGNGICKVYNAAAAKAKFGLFCFVHEDVVFATSNWGQNIAHHLSNMTTGLVGIAGGDTKSLVPSSWYISARSNHIHVFQHYQHKAAKPSYIRIGISDQSHAINVAVLDGVFLCTRKDVFLHFRFDEINFQGFHGYDIDYSLQVSSAYKIKVVPDILIHHYSEGRPGKDWMDSTLMVSRKWKTQLPVSAHPLSKKAFQDHHWASMQVFIQRMVQLDYSLFFIIRNFALYSFNKFFNARRFSSMSKYLVAGLFIRYKTRLMRLMQPIVNPPIQQRS